MTVFTQVITTDAQRLASDPEDSSWVSANAGSGKTHVLIDRMVRLMLQGAKPARIVCLTFTKAAAAEMERRLFGRLSEWTGLDDTRLGSHLAALTGMSSDAGRNSGGAATVRDRSRNPGAAPHSDHPRLLRKTFAAFSSGGRRCTGLPDHR